MLTRDWKRHAVRHGKAACGWNGKCPEEGELTSIDGIVTCHECLAAACDEEIYRCQFCTKESPAHLWIKDACPCCGQKYDAILAQDCEEDGAMILHDMLRVADELERIDDNDYLVDKHHVAIISHAAKLLRQVYSLIQQRDNKIKAMRCGECGSWFDPTTDAFKCPVCGTENTIESDL